MREYTSMMTIILEIAYDDQEQPVDVELVSVDINWSYFLKTRNLRLLAASSLVHIGCLPLFFILTQKSIHRHGQWTCRPFRFQPRFSNPGEGSRAVAEFRLGVASVQAEEHGVGGLQAEEQI